MPSNLFVTLPQDFAQLVRQRQPEALDPWLQRATTSALEALRRFATGPRTTMRPSKPA